MIYQTLISTTELNQKLVDNGLVIIDCRYSLQDPHAGREAYQAGHIPGAVFADLEQDLCGPIVPGATGRHPLPEMAFFARRLRSWGVNQDSQVVVYDAASGAYAARLWWMLRWIGHTRTAVLDGGWPAWIQTGHEVSEKTVEPVQGNIVPGAQDQYLITSQELYNRLDDKRLLILDARERERYLGQREPIDPIAGHIPGAESQPYPENLNPDGTFKPPAELRRMYLRTGTQPDETIFYCGSGVTAASNVLAYEIAGLGPARLYVGSWSEWITDPARPIATGAHPETVMSRGKGAIK